VSTQAVSTEEISGLVRRGVGWMMASQGVMQALAFLTSVLIARLMSPRQVGLANEAVVFVSLALVLVDFGVASVVVQRPRLTELETSSLFWAGSVLGLVLALIGVGLSGPIADLYGEPKVRALFAVLSVTFLVTGPGIVQGALLTRELRFRNLELRTIAATIASCATAIVLAALGAGPWAIVAQTITMASVSTVLLWRSSTWRPKWIFSFAVLREFGAFASNVFGAKMLYWANANVDNLLVGRFLGAASLGAYSLAFAVALTPVNRIAIPITQVFFPAFSRLRDREPIAEVWLRAVGMLAFFVAPAMFGLIVVAPDLVPVVFGEKWRHAAPVMQFLAAIALLQTLTALHDGVLQAIEQTRVLFRFTAALSFLTLIAFAAGLPWGIRGVGAAYLIVSVIMQPLFVWLTARVVGVSPVDWLRSVSGSLEASLAMLVVCALARRVLVHAGVPIGVRLVTVVVCGGIFYVPAAAWLAPESVKQLRTTLERRRGRAAA
jgi:O-antigen/teichoic acid export membrane protein